MASNRGLQHDAAFGINPLYGDHVMDPTHELTDDLLQQLQDALLRVRKLEDVLLHRAKDRGILGHKEMSPGQAQGEITGGESLESTRTLDLTSLFRHDVTSSGSYYTKGIRSTLFGRLLEALPVPSLLVGGSRDVVFANRAWARTSIPCEDIVGNRFANLFPTAAIAEEFDSLAESVFVTRKVFSREAVVAVGNREIWARLTLRSIRLGPERLLLVLIEDLTAQKRELLQKQKYQDSLKHEIRRRKEVEQDLRESQQRLELALKGAELSFWDWDIETNRLVLDNRFVEALGYAVDEIGLHKEFWENLIHRDDKSRVEAAFRNHLLGDSAFLECEYRVRTKAGAWKWILTRGKVLLRNKRGESVRALGTNLDVSERKKLEHRSQQFTRAMIQAVDRERERISLDLHDLVAQDLVALKLGLDTMLDDYTEVPSGLNTRVAQVSDKLLQLVQMVREISYHLRPAGLDQLGLVSTVEEYCREFADRYRLSIECQATGMKRLHLDFDTKINLFRVVQEALNNVRKHACASKVLVSLRGSDKNIKLMIRDDGRGFEADKALHRDAKRQQMGLWSMEQRVAILQGKLEVRTKPDKGTEIFIEIPNRGLKHAQETDLDC